jgi:nucleotidyltransferase/DNA polymerase involved in DNA repair
MGKLSELKGLGPKTESYLNEIGIHTKGQLEEIGAVGAYIKLKEQCSVNPSLNFLYALVGALEDKHWAQIAKSEKGRLLYELEGYRELEKMLKLEIEEDEELTGSVTNKEFQIIPGVGKSLSQDLVDLGYRKVRELKTENPESMYQNLMQLRGSHIDRCVLYVFRCAVYYAANTSHDPELLKWWNWKDEKNK